MNILKNIKYIFCLFFLIFPTYSYACYSDAECNNDQICNEQGQCVSDGRNWLTIKKKLNETQNLLKGAISENNDISINNIKSSKKAGYVCCEYYDSKTKYSRVPSASCKAVSGTEVDSSKCN